MNKDDLKQEWSLLQNQFDSYEKHSLIIKLIHLTFVGLLLAMDKINVSIILVALCFWLLDGIWKTFQSRIETRLLKLEDWIKNEDDKLIVSHQFNSDFLSNRGGTAALIAEYIKNSLKPTVAFPHIILVLLLLVA